MGGKWSHRAKAAEHKRLRAALMRQVVWGQTECCRCRHKLEAGDQIQLDHADEGDGYQGWSHGSPCRVCLKRCNQSAGGAKGAERQGKRPRERACAVCGIPYVASRGTSGAESVTCGRQPCLSQLRAARKAREPGPQPPPASGRVW